MTGDGKKEGQIDREKKRETGSEKERGREREYLITTSIRPGLFQSAPLCVCY